jgi:hypothetical protein
MSNTDCTFIVFAFEQYWDSMYSVFGDESKKQNTYIDWLYRSWKEGLLSLDEYRRGIQVNL